MSRCFLACLVSAVLISSCSGNHRLVRSNLAAADSLLNVDPLRSLDLMYGLDSLESLNRREKAYRDYVLTSARYKSYFPIADDTAIFSAVDYFRRRGPEEYYGKSLMMQGAVQLEQDRLEEALETYKLAESILEKFGTYLDLGLLNARMGELYRLSYVNDSASVDRLWKAVHYFNMSGDRRRIAASSLDYARSIMTDSLDRADELIRRGLEISREIGDSALMLYARELSVYIEGQGDDHLKFIEMANALLSEIERDDVYSLSENTYNNLYFKLSDKYAGLGMADEARKSLSNVAISSDTDSLLYYYAEEKIAKLGNDWPEAYGALERSGELYNRIVADNYDRRLVEAELRYDLSRAEEDHYKNQNRNLVIIIFLLLGFSLSAVITLIVRNRLKDKKREVQEYAARLMLAEKELNDSAWKRDALGSQVENQRKGNMELQKLSGELMNMINEIGYAYEINKDNTNPARMVESIKRQIESSLSMQGFEDKARRILDILYPGMLDEIFAEADPALNEEEKWIIILMCCKFETNTICLFCNNSVTQLNNKKSRISKKLPSAPRLSKYLSRRMEEKLSHDTLL